MTRALVIGATGFVGLNLVDALLARGVRVRCTRRRHSITAHLRRRPVELVDLSDDDGTALRRAMRGCDVVYYTAAPYPRYSLDPDREVQRATEATATVVTSALAARVRRLVCTGSTGILDPAPAHRPADARDIPRTMPADSVYRASKWATHAQLVTARAAGLEVGVLLCGGCLGPWDVRAGTGGLLVATIAGALPWYTEGLVHLVDVRDVAHAHIAAADPGCPAIDHCLPGHSVALTPLLRRVVRRHGGHVPTRILGATTARVTADRDERRAAPDRLRVPFPRELVDLIAAGQPIERNLGPRTLGITLTPLDRSIDDAVAWFRRFGYLPRQPQSTQENSV